MSELAKALPGFGSVVVLAKVLHRRAEGREEDFTKGFTERDYVLDLEDAVQDKNGFLAAAEQAIAITICTWNPSIRTLIELSIAEQKC